MAQALNIAMKAVDALKNIQQQSTNNSPDGGARKAEKIACCSTIAENVCVPSVKSAPHFSQVLSLSIKRLLELCDDSESDVRTTADECLNRIIRSMADGNVIKVQFELYNTISKNGSARSLRAALWRFAILSHTIRPIKGKAYVSNLMPCVVAISQRTEESVIETLAQSLPLILKSLGPFMTDKDVKTLLKAFYKNLSSSQPVFRRNAASMILTTCLCCRKPSIFLSYVLRNLIDTLVPVSQTEDNAHLVIGVLGCLRQILPHTKAPLDPQIEIDAHRLDCLIQIYDLCLHYAKWHSDHNMINAALETLAELLRSPDEDLIEVLTSERGITSSKIVATDSAATRVSLGHMSASTTTISGDPTEIGLNLIDPELPEINPKVEQWISDPINNFNNVQRPLIDRSSELEIFETSKDHSENRNESIDETDLDILDDKIVDSNNLAPSEKGESEFSDDSSQFTGSRVPNREIGIEIGSFTDAAVPLRYACRYLASSFLLTGRVGQLVPDKHFRVSVKSLALTCIGNILRLYPRTLSATLGRNPILDGNQQMIADILLFADHADPQIRGNVAILVGSYITACYAKSKGNYEKMEEEIVKNQGEILVPLGNLTKLLVKGLEDDSTTACRQTLVALNKCLPEILESEDNKHGISLINKLLRLVDNPYFLVKVQLTKVLSELPYIAIKYITGNFDFQENVTKVLLTLLANQDPRIRNAATEAIVRIVPSFYHQHPNENEATRKAADYTEQYLSTIINEATLTETCQMEQKALVESLVEPFKSFYNPSKNHETLTKFEHSLSIIVSLLMEKLLINRSKHLSYGCCEALSRLSEVYPTTIYPKAWDCCFVPKIDGKKSSVDSAATNRMSIETNESGLTEETLTPIGKGILSLATTMLSSSSLCLDLSTHSNLIRLAGNIISGIALRGLKSNDETAPNGKDVDLWDIFVDESINRQLESLFSHITRLLNIYLRVIEGVQFATPSVKSALPLLHSAQSLSPRRKIPGVEPKSKERGEKTMMMNVLKIGKEQQTGYFFSMPHYAKLYEILKVAHSNYSSTLDSEASKMYLTLLNASLEVLSQILEISRSQEASKFADEILHYLQTTLILSPTTSVRCVRQLLKCLFSTNFNARRNEFEVVRKSQVKTEDYEQKRGLYAQCFQRPAKRMARIVKAMGNNCRGGNEPEVGGWIGSLRRRREDRKLATVFKSLARASSQKSSVTSFIRIFEPMVISSMKQYTTSGSVPFQCQVLALLKQLLQLHVNYCLLDTDKIFIGLVLDQFSFIDEGQIQQPEELLPKIFGFLVHLSYKKLHSKTIIDVPKIIQLCDGLMASGQPPKTHCIPALVPIVEDIFLARSAGSSTNQTSDYRELETTREVLMTTMLRLIEYPRVVELLARCIAESRFDADDSGNGEEKWRRWSRLATDAILPMLASRKIRIETRTGDAAFIKLFSAVSPTVFRPVDPLLKVLFAVPPQANESLAILKRWLGTTNIVILALISYAKEETMLARLSDLTVCITDLSRVLSLPEAACTSGDPLNVTQESRSFSVSPEKILAIFLFRAIGISVKRIHESLGSVDYRRELIVSSTLTDSHLVHQLAFFLQLCIHMFESGGHRKIADATISMIRGRENESLPIAELNSLMLDVADACPLLTCHWTYLTTLLGYNEFPFWSRILGIEDESKNSKILQSSQEKYSINTKIVREAGIMLFSEHVAENLKDAEPLAWLLVNRIEETIRSATESPVRDLLINAIHKNSSASGLLIQAIAARCRDLSKPSFVKKLLQCIGSAHNSQSGAVILVLIPRFLSLKHLALSRIAATIASRRAEIVLASGTEDALDQLSREDFLKIMDILRSTKLGKKYGALASLMNKLGVAHYDLSPMELERSRPFNPSSIKNLRLDKNWFLTQVKQRCCSRASADLDLAETARLLANLDLEDCDAILGSKEFDLKILIECVRSGVRMTRENARICEFSGKEKPERACAIYRSAKRWILRNVLSINKLLPKPHQIYVPSSSKNSGKSAKYSTRLSNLIEDSIYRETLLTIIPAVTNYVNTLPEIARSTSMIDEENDDNEDLARFALLSLETINWMLDRHENNSRRLKPHELESALNCADELLKNDEISKIFGKEIHYSWICSTAKTLKRLVEHWSKKSSDNPLTIENLGLSDALNDQETKKNAEACFETSALVSWLENSEFTGESRDIPKFVSKRLKNLIIVTSRQPLVNGYVLTPPLAWKHGWQATGSGPTRCDVPLLTAESNLLQELDVLQQFVYRTTLLGWNSRLQFEEMWMSLLSVLSVSSPSENESTNEDFLQNQATSLAVQAITRLLAQTLLLPSPGNPGNSRPIHHPRDPQLALHKTSSQRLCFVQETLSWKYEFASNAGRNTNDVERLEHLFERGNIERNANSSCEFTYGQLSIPYLWSLSSVREDKLSTSVISLKKRRDEALEAARLDLGSCLRFLIELYSRWTIRGANVPPRLLNEVVKSLVTISELFIERSQFQWMLETCLELSRVHTTENEILHHYLVVAVCKAAAVLAPLDLETLEKVKRSVDLSLQSSFLPARITALHGMLYLLQSAVLANCEETMNVVHPLAIKYIQKHVEVQEENGVLGQSEEHQRIMWALVFFLLEHAEDTQPEAEPPAVLEFVLTLVTMPNISTDLHRTLLQGLERLIGTRSVVGRIADQIVKVAVERLRQPSPGLALPALQLLLTCMYTEGADRFNRPEIEEPLPDIEPEALVRSIERTAAIFDRIKRGYPTEVQVLCAVLSEVLADFFPPSDILTKVIGEFLSPQQPHQRLLSEVVFKVCERVACNGTQLGLLQDWLVFSLPNFIQSLPLPMSTWCLSCFFVSASTNPWLRALFPHVQSRIGKYEYEDKKILCIAAADFYHRLSNESQRKAFVESFEAAAKEVGNPFSDILGSF